MTRENYNGLQILWKFVGLAPFHYDKNGNCGFSYPALIIGVCLIGWSVPQSIYTLYLDTISDCKSSVRNLNKTATVVTCCDVGTLMLASTVSVFLASVQYKKLARISSTLTSTALRLGHSKILSKADIIGLIILILFCTLLTIDFIMSWENIVYFLPTYAFHIIIFSFELQVSTIALKINLLFKLINEKLSKSISHNELKPSRENGILPTIDNLQGLNTIIKEVQGMNDFSELHWNICSVIDDVNSAFGCQLATVFFSIFIHIIITPYFIVLAIGNPKTYGTKNFQYLALQITWVLTHVGQLFLLVWPCSLATKQGSSISTIICKFLNKGLPSETKKQCETFLLQLLYHDTNFSATGLFQLDLPVITSIFGAVSTYLVILIQFQNDDQGC